MRERRAECLIVRLSRFEERPRREVECEGLMEGEGRLDLGRRVRGRGVGIVGAWEGGQWMGCGGLGRGVDHCVEGLRWGRTWVGVWVTVGWLRRIEDGDSTLWQGDVSSNDFAGKP